MVQVDTNEANGDYVSVDLIPHVVGYNERELEFLEISLTPQQQKC